MYVTVKINVRDVGGYALLLGQRERVPSNEGQEADHVNSDRERNGWG